MPSTYPIESQKREERLLLETVSECESEYPAIRHVTSRLGIAADTLSG